MPAKPATIQACNTQSCSETRCNGSNRWYINYTRGCEGRMCIRFINSGSGNVVWDGVVVSGASDTTTSVSANGYRFTRGGMYSSNSNSYRIDDCGGEPATCDGEDRYYCVTRAPL